VSASAIKVLMARRILRVEAQRELARKLKERER